VKISRATAAVSRRRRHTAFLASRGRRARLPVLHGGILDLRVIKRDQLAFGYENYRGNVRDSSQPYFDGVLAHERDFWRMTMRRRDASRELARVQPYRAVAAYTDFLLAIAWQRGPGETIAAMTPCMRLYGYLGTELAKTIGAGNPYQQWIATYSGADFQALVTRVESLLDSIAEDTLAVRDAYEYAMRCELNFFSAMLEPTA
jgi:thiaminase